MREGKPQKQAVAIALSTAGYKTSPLKEGPEKERLVKLLMKARRDVKNAKNKKEERLARRRVQKYKVALGERNGSKNTKKKRSTRKV